MRQAVKGRAASIAEGGPSASCGYTRLRHVCGTISSRGIHPPAIVPTESEVAAAPRNEDGVDQKCENLQEARPSDRERNPRFGQPSVQSMQEDGDNKDKCRCRAQSPPWSANVEIAGKEVAKEIERYRDPPAAGLRRNGSWIAHHYPFLCGRFYWPVPPHFKEDWPLQTRAAQVGDTDATAAFDGKLSCTGSRQRDGDARQG